MTNTFISYSHDDSNFVERLENKLNGLSDIDATYDKKILNGGDDLLELFGEIGRSDAVICVLSPSSVESAFVGKEISSAIIKEIRESGFTFVPVIKGGSNFDTIMNKMSKDLETVIKTYHMPRFDKSFDNGIKQVVRALNENIDSERIFHRATSEDADNPFARTRTENLENDRMRAHLFAKPDPQRYDKMAEIKPTIIQGARGTGKTMVLKSLKTNVCMMRESSDSLKESELNQFGVYIRASQGAFETGSEDVERQLEEPEMKVTSMTEFILRLIESLIDEIQNAKKEGYIKKDIKEEKSLVNEIQIPLDLDGDISTLDDVLQKLKRDLYAIQNYVHNSLINNDPSYSGIHLRKDHLSDVCESVNSYLPGENYTIYFLVDEYENLLDFQKEIVNTLVKWSESETFTFKIASKTPCFNNPNTLEDQELEEPHDYGSVDLNYDLSEERKAYKDLLIEITNNIFEERGYGHVSISELLENRKKYDGYSEYEIKQQIAEMRDEDMDWWNNLTESKQSRMMNKYSKAAFYQLNDEKYQSGRDFGGFDELSQLSSGIVRHFLEVCSMSYYFEKSDNDIPLEDGISVENQTLGVSNLSEYYLERIRQNVDGCGPELYQFMIDIGDILEEKLLNHTSEPEAAKINIENPNKITEESLLGQVLYKAEEHSVLLKKSSREPKNREQPMPDTYHINRIFTPVLDISPNYRWHTTFHPDDLKNLLDESNRIETRDRLIVQLAKGDQDTHQQKLDTDYDNE